MTDSHAPSSPTPRRLTDGLLLILLLGSLSAVFAVDRSSKVDEVVALNGADASALNETDSQPVGTLLSAPKQPAAETVASQQEAQQDDKLVAQADEYDPDDFDDTSTPPEDTAATETSATDTATPESMADTADTRELVANIAIEKKLEYVETIPKPFVETLKEDEVAKVEFFDTKAKAKSVVFLVDRSGSMRGRPLDRTRVELLKAVLNLKKGQKFHVVFFSSGYVTMPQGGLPVALEEASPRVKGQTYKWMNAISANGGTNPEPALYMIADKLRPDVIYLLTDGKFQAISQRTIDLLQKRKSQVHTISFLNPGAADVLERVATATNGTYRFIGRDPLVNPAQERKQLVAEMTQQLVLSLRSPGVDLAEMRDALRSFSGLDFGPSDNPTPEETEKSIKDWTAWWVDNQLIPSIKNMSPEVLARQLKHTNPLRRVVAATVIGHRKIEELADELVEALADADADVVQKVREALVAISGGLDNGPARDATDEQKLAATESWKRWLQSLLLVKNLASENPAVIKAKLRDADAIVRQAALIAIRQRGIEADAELVAALQDEAASVRKEAHHSLVQVSGYDFGPKADGLDAARVAAGAWSRWLAMRRVLPQIKRLTGSALLDQLNDRDTARRWAVLVIAAEKNIDLPAGKLIAMLKDGELSIRQASHTALVKVAKGRDFGPAPDASPEQIDEAIVGWRTWQLEFEEKKASSKLKLAKQLHDKGNATAAKRWLREVVQSFPGTPSAAEAQRILDTL